MSPQRTVLIVEDSPSMAMTYKAHLEPLGYSILLAGDGKTAFECLHAQPVDCVLLDLKLPDMDGIDILEEVRTWPAPPAVIVVTANASLTTGVNAVRRGAFDYLVKPISAARLATTVEIALSGVDLRREVETLRRTVEPAGFADFVGRSLPMQAVYRTIEAAAQSTASVFITGESGTGKELTAEALHRLSARKNRAFVALNCGAIPKDLLESVIFGHVKGAFTGATTDQEGAAQRSDGGTLFLDEIGEMDPLLQTKLLRFIQTGSYERVGDLRPRRANIRFLAATNRDPTEAVRSGRLREDLFYRLNVVPIRMPPLRDRGEDIVLIARRFLTQFAASEHRQFKSFAPEVEAWFLSYSWPGNVRQLQNVVRNIVVLHDARVVTLDMLPPLEETTLPPESPAPPAPAPAPQPEAPAPAIAAPAMPAMPASPDAIETLAVAERRYIEHAIALCGDNLQLAARKLGISPSTIYRKKEIWERP
jgi:two-component system repressor protein LuxO